MSKRSGSNINIRKVVGNVVMSDKQSGGVTMHQQTASPSSRKKKPFYEKILFWIGVISAVLTILAYFGLQPKPKENKNINPKIGSLKLNSKDTSSSKSQGLKINEKQKRR